jgi:hypothetical protein
MTAITISLILCLTVPVLAQDELQITATPSAHHVTNKAALIRWKTNVPASGLVRYGSDFNKLDQVAAEIPQNGKLHKVRLYNLRSRTIHYYQVVSSVNGINVASYINEFRTSGSFVGQYTEPSVPLLR